jgi:hypothetical protein
VREDEARLEAMPIDLPRDDVSPCAFDEPLDDAEDIPF